MYTVKRLLKVHKIDAYTAFCHLRLCSMILRSISICSVHDLPLLKPACSSRNRWSTWVFSLLNGIRQNTLPGVGRRVIPLQLLQSLRHPFLGYGMIMPSLHSSGISSACHIWLNNSMSTSATGSPPCFSNSAGISSKPAASLFFSLQMALAVSEI